MSSSVCWKYSSSRFRCSLDLNWCFRSWRTAVFKAQKHELGCSRCFQRRIWEKASDWLNSFVDGGEDTEKRVDQLGFTSNGFKEPIPFTLYIGLWDVYDTVLINIFKVSPKPFVCWTARFKRDLCGWRAKLREWKMMTKFYLISQAARQPRGTWRAQCGAASWWEGAQCGAASWWEGHTDTVQRLDTTHFYCPPVTLKRKSDDLIFAWSRKLHDGARGIQRAQCGAASWWEGNSRFEDWTQHTFILLPPPPPLSCPSHLNGQFRS